MRTTLIYIV